MPAQTAHVPAPVGGINTIDPLGAMPDGDAIVCVNLVAGGDNGLRTRLGYREWCTGLTGEVRAIMPFTGSKANGSTNKLFAATPGGIYDVTSSSAAPTLVQAFGTTTGNAGYCTSCVMVTAGGHFFLVVDEVNGLFCYTESTTTWAAVAMGGGAAQIANVDPATFCHVMVWKNRVWFTQKDTALSWYLPINSIYGAAASFNFGTKFRKGGTLVGLYNWTYDGGSGADDLLVAVSQGGDVALYVGTDPSAAATFGMKGVWDLGGVPAGRQIGTNFGGDLLLLSTLGILPLSRLVAGSVQGDEGQYATRKISNLFRDAMYSSSSLQGWSLRLHPQDGTLLVTVPVASGQATTQLAMSMATKGWSQYRDLPIYSCEVFGGQLYFGTVDGKVCVNTGYLDGVTLADTNVFSAIAYSLITAFTALGSATQKRFSMVRVSVQSQGDTPNFQLAAKHRFDTSEMASVSDTSTVSAGSVWDAAVWETAIWGGAYSPTTAVRGLTGMSAAIALAIRGTARSKTNIVGFDVVFDTGGFL